ncbi:aldo/keto reductase [Sediminibacillus albus]|uniref:Predicted oxidoreductase n=1 Tax=Sediminibacillus albus TaxID=407036 RepID=A0A1G8WEN9_9BACI|nr:aldo/keto reductase [Sediminibacillus albus]SDJ76155.1 Predicted oxidoreductase [Sediminibacillus albus]
MEKTKIKHIDMEMSKIGLGTWAIGGFQWGGTNEQEAIKTIHTALDKGINVIDTAPGHGFGKAEEIVGNAIKSYAREEIIISSKTGLNWKENRQLFRDSSKAHIHKDIEKSLDRLQTDYIDVYHVHWPDTYTPFYETAEALNYLYNEGKIRAIGLSNFSPEQMDIFREAAPVHAIQAPHNLFERDSENNVLAYAEEKELTAFFYSSLTRGLLTGKITGESNFKAGDIRLSEDPKFQQPRLEQYLSAVKQLDHLAQDRFSMTVLELALQWNLQQPGSSVSLWGARRPHQLQPLEKLGGFKIDDDTMKDIDEILLRTIKSPIEPDFMAPPTKYDI